MFVNVKHYLSVDLFICVPSLVTMSDSVDARQMNAKEYVWLK